jgi:fumarylacetoacetase
VFGFALLNDWSARDIQSFGVPPARPVPRQVVRDQPGAWITPLQALEPYSSEPAARTPSRSSICAPKAITALDIELEIELNGETISRTNARHLYWTFPQQLAHATVNGAHPAGRPVRRRHDLGPDARQRGLAAGARHRLPERRRHGRPQGRRGSVSLGEVRGTIAG